MTKIPRQLGDIGPSQGQVPPSASSVVLTIAGFDPSSGAGITADLKTFAAHGLFGVSCITALTVQSTQGVRQVEPVQPGLVARTLACLASDVELAGIKIGMLATGGIAGEVAGFLEQMMEQDRVQREHIVLDPLLRSSSGAVLLDDAGLRVMRERLLALAGWTTPNLDELAALIGTRAVTRESIPEAAVELQTAAARAGNPGLNVAVTGGHLERPDEYLLEAGITANAPAGMWLSGERVETTSTHGTGCAFSSALLCQLVQGRPALEAVVGAKRYVTGALRAAYPIGKGRGPMHHLYERGY